MTIGNLFYFVLFIGVLIFVHELGHFLFAKLFDVKVLKFSLGFGPSMASFRRGETEYVVAWVPLGGFVKMLGEDPNDEIKPDDHGRAFNQKPLWQRYIVVLAGPAFNLIFPICIYFFFYAAQTHKDPAVVGRVLPGMPAAEAGLRPGDRIVGIDRKEIRYYEELLDTVSDSPGKPLRFVIERDAQRIERLITPIEQLTHERVGLEERVGKIGVSPYFQLAQVGISDLRTPAARCGLRTGDAITAVNGASIDRWAQLEKVLHANRGQSLHIAYLRPGGSVSPLFSLRVLTPSVTVLDPEPRRDQGKTVYETGIFSADLYVARVDPGSPAEKMGMRVGDRVTQFNGQPLHDWDTMHIALNGKKKATHNIAWVPVGGSERSSTFKLAHVTFVDDYRQEQQQYVFGAHNRVLQRTSPLIPIDGRLTYAISKAVRRTGEMVGLIAIAFVQLFRGAIPRDTIGGPLMIYYAAGAAARKGWDQYLGMLALISINLGILNLLPIPILDGGHVMFFTIEAVKRRPLSLRAREIASYVGLVLLISLMVFAFKNDIVRYWFK
jgi:regulator of sigma E protease